MVWNWNEYNMIPASNVDFFVGVQPLSWFCILASQVLVLLMDEILHHLGCIKPCKSWENYLSTGAGFLPSTVVPGQTKTPG